MSDSCRLGNDACSLKHIPWRKQKQVCCPSGSMTTEFCRCLPHSSPGNKIPFLNFGDFCDLRVVRKVGTEAHNLIIIMDFYTYQYIPVLFRSQHMIMLWLVWGFWVVVGSFFAQGAGTYFAFVREHFRFSSYHLEGKYPHRKNTLFLLSHLPLTLILPSYLFISWHYCTIFIQTQCHGRLRDQELPCVHRRTLFCCYRLCLVLRWHGDYCTRNTNLRNNLYTEREGIP